ncbi:hypothetical protein [Microbacterium kribbense]
MRGKEVLVVYEAAEIMVFDTRRFAHHRASLATVGIKYVGNGKHREPRKKTEPSPMSRDITIGSHVLSRYGQTVGRAKGKSLLNRDLHGGDGGI